MIAILKHIVVGALAALFFVPLPCVAQSRANLQLVKQGMDYIYNKEFTRSAATIRKIESSMNRSAIPDLMKAMEVFWRYYPIHTNEKQLTRYQEFLMKSYARTQEVLGEDESNPEAIFLAMASQGLLAESYAESGRSFKAVGAAKRAYNYIKQGSRRIGQYQEFLLTTGLYNYYREYYPEAHPIYRPLMSFFMKGDKELGIKQLEMAAKDASISHVIAQYYLGYIYMRYEYIPHKALRQGRKLYKSYPKNDLFQAIYLESLIINGKYKEARPLAKGLQQNSNPYSKIYGQLFLGVIEEKDGNIASAENLYRSTLKLNQDHEMERDHLEAYAYLGLGRIYERKNDPQARKYFKESLDKAYTKALQNEAKRHLN